MSLVENLKSHSEELGSGIGMKTISDLETRLDISFPSEFKEYLCELNYAEIFSDPIYGINPEIEELDLYTQNKGKEHLRHGFLEIFANDIDGSIYIRPDTGAVYDAGFGNPIAKSFSDYVSMVLGQSS